MLKDIPVHMLWVSGELSRLARLSLASFVANGFRVHLWSYEPEKLKGAGVTICDAATVLPRDFATFDNMAYLTSLFRYTLLNNNGGLWSDLDVVALTPEPRIPVTCLLASEKRRPFRHSEPTATGNSLTQVTNCFMLNSRTNSVSIFTEAARRVMSLSPQDRTWENVGPHLLSRLLLEIPDHGITILPTETVDPVAWWNVPGYFLEDRDLPPSPFMHMYATIWAKRGIDAEAPFPEHSLAGRLWKKFGL